MPAIVTETGSRPLIVLPNANEVRDSHSLRSVDLLDFCPNAKRVAKHEEGYWNDPHRSDTVDVEYATVAGQKCIYVSCSIRGIGSAGVYRYPETDTESMLAELFQKVFAEKLGCDSHKIAQLIIEHAPWK